MNRTAPVDAIFLLPKLHSAAFKRRVERFNKRIEDMMYALQVYYVSQLSTERYVVKTDL